MKLNERLTLSIALTLLGALMVFLGLVLGDKADLLSGFSVYGIVLIFVGFLTIICGLAYGITRPMNGFPDAPAPPYLINDPNRAKDAARDIQINSSLGLYDGFAGYGMPATSIKDKEK